MRVRAPSTPAKIVMYPAPSLSKYSTAMRPQVRGRPRGRGCEAQVVEVFWPYPRLNTYCWSQFHRKGKPFVSAIALAQARLHRSDRHGAKTTAPNGTTTRNKPP